MSTEEHVLSSLELKRGNIPGNEMREGVRVFMRRVHGPLYKEVVTGGREELSPQRRQLAEL